MKVFEMAPETDPLNLASTLSDLAVVRQAQGNYVPARLLCEKVLRICEKAPDKLKLQARMLTAKALSNLAVVLTDQGDYDEARRIIERAINFQEGLYGPNHPELVTLLSNWAGWVLAGEGW